MRQQINLYQPIFSEERKALSAITVATGLLVIAGGLAGFSVYSHQRVAALEIATQALRDQVNEQQDQLTQASEQQAAQAKPVDVEARFKQLTATVSERERALQVLQSGAAGQTTGFAARMEALARRHVAGVWLDGLKLSGTSASMSLQGSTTNPDIVPVYLRSLADDAVLAGTRFDEFMIERPDANKAAAKGSSATTDESAEPASKARARVQTVRFSAGSTSLPAPASKDTAS